MGTVIYPDRFKHQQPPVGLSGHRAVQIYTSLLNLHQSIHHGIISHQQLNQFILKHPVGMDGANTLIAASAVSKNETMLHKVIECIGMIINIMLVDAGSMPMDINYIQGQQEKPDDQPPAA